MQLGIDIGGSSLRIGLVEKRRIIKKIKEPIKKTKKEIIAQIENNVRKFNGYEFKEIGIGIPGTTKNNKVVFSPHAALEGTNLKQVLEKTLKKKVSVKNDADCFALGEAVFGAGKGKKFLVGITLGSGVGSGIVINGKIYRGKGNASESGHMTIDYNGPKSACGSSGCIEEYISRKGILRLANEHRLKVENPLELFGLAEKGNSKAKKVFEEMGYYLGIYLANLSNILDPEIIVIGGNISNAWKYFETPMKKEFKKRALDKNLIIRKSALGDDAGIFGASLL